MSDLQWAWHVHHDILLEPLTGDGIKERLAYIRTNKDETEIPTRERLLKVVRHPEQLPAKVIEIGLASEGAWLAHIEAARASAEEWWRWEEGWRTYAKTWRSYTEARRIYEVTVQACLTEIETLHREECPGCPWDGHTIFPEASDGRD